jgi:hypothetical protein
LDLRRISELQKEIIAMRISEAKYAVVAMIAVLLLTSCGGPSTSSMPVAGAQNQAHTIKHNAHHCPCLYAPNAGEYGIGYSITVYPVGKTGNVAPIQYIHSSKTGLSQPVQLAVDNSGDIYAANYGNNSVTIYDAGATGNAKPKAVISGSNTGIIEPMGVAIDPVNGDIYVENNWDGSVVPSITFYAPGSNGNVAPLGTITDSSGSGFSQLGDAFGITLDPNGNIYVNGYTLLQAFAAGSNGNVTPTLTISGSNTMLVASYDVALDSSLNIYAVNNPGASAIAFSAGANGNVSPIIDIVGNETELANPEGVALDASNNIYVANSFELNRRGVDTPSITVYPAGSSGNTKPSRIIQGRKTKLDHPWGIVIH